MPADQSGLYLVGLEVRDRLHPDVGSINRLGVSAFINSIYVRRHPVLNQRKRLARNDGRVIRGHGAVRGVLYVAGGAGLVVGLEHGVTAAGHGLDAVSDETVSHQGSFKLGQAAPPSPETGAADSWDSDSDAS